MLTALAVAALALVMAVPVLADAPTRVTTTATFSLVDDETCAFVIDVAVDRTRTVTTFANGDVTRHVDLQVTSSANGKAVIERDRFSVFIDHAAPDVWQITGTFTHARSGSGGTVALQSGRLLYDAVADVVVDTHPGPHPTDSAGVLCASLA